MLLAPVGQRRTPLANTARAGQSEVHCCTYMTYVLRVIQDYYTCESSEDSSLPALMATLSQRAPVTFIFSGRHDLDALPLDNPAIDEST